MKPTFENITRAAIEEIVLSNVQKSRFGYILSTEAADSLCDDILKLLMTSRTLKEKGDKILAAGLSGLGGKNSLRNQVKGNFR